MVLYWLSNKWVQLYSFQLRHDALRQNVDDFNELN